MAEGSKRRSARGGSPISKRIIAQPGATVSGTEAQVFGVEELNTNTVPAFGDEQRRRARPRNVALRTIIATALSFAIAAACWNFYQVTGPVGPSPGEGPTLTPGRPQEEKPTPPEGQLEDKLAEDQESLEEYGNKLEAASKQLQEKWESASQPVKDAFLTYYFPPMEDAPQDGNPLGIFMGYADAVRSEEIPLDATSELRNEYVARLRLVTSMLAAASKRIEAIAESEEFCTTRGVAFPMFNRVIDTEKLTSPTEDVVTFEQFTRMLPGREIELFDEDSTEAESPKIPRILAQQLADTITLQDLQVKQDLAVQEEFSSFLQAVGDGTQPEGLAHRKLTMPEGKRKFPIGVFKTELDGFREIRNSYTVASSTIEFWSMEWDVQGAMKNLQYLERNDQKRLSRGVETKKEFMEDSKGALDPATPKDDISPVVLYLL